MWRMSAALLWCLLVSGCAAPAVPAPTESPPGPWTVPATPAVDGAGLVAQLEDWATRFPHRTGGSQDHRGAREVLAQRLESAGLELWRQAYDSNGYRQENVCGIRLGEREPDVWVVVGGHYDVIAETEYAARSNVGYNATQGAYDNGSGTWMTMGLATAYAAVTPYVSLLFCAFDGEERGVIGSGRVFKAMDEESGFPYPVRSFRAMINLDMFGICPPTRTPVRVVHNHEFLAALVDGERRAMGIPDELFVAEHNPRDRGSDHEHWMRVGVPTLTFDSNFDSTAVPGAPAGSGLPVTYPFWHRGDTMETMRAAAGGDEMLRRGFATCAELAARSVGIVALRTEIARIES